MVPIAAIQAVPIAVIVWYRLHRYAWYRYSAIVTMEAYIKSNMRYPSNSYYNRIEGTVIISTEIKHDGSIGDQKVKQSVNDELDREAQRIISYMPKWEPATEEGTKMKSIVDISIKFQISDFGK